MLSSINSPNLIDAMVVNMEHAFKMCALYAPQAESIDTPEMLRYWTGVAHPFANAVVRAVLSESEAPNVIRETLEYYVGKQVPTMWFVTPTTRPDEIGELLVEAGMTARNESPAMVLDMTHRPTMPPLATGVGIAEVNDVETAQIWAEVATVGSSVPAAIGDFFVNVAEAEGFGPGSPMRLFLATLNGTPVASSSLVVEGGIAGIYCVATLEAYRRRGLGAAMTMAPLVAAWDEGYRVGTLQASNMGKPVYDRLGFLERFPVRIFTYNTGG